MPLTVVIAPDSFKGSLPAWAAAEAISEGWRQARPDDTIALRPQADGGEGTIDAIASTVPATVRHRIRNITGPDGRPADGSWLELPDGVAVVELAESSGLPLMATPDALGATTYGLGEVIRAALSSGARSLVIALGGSASTDGGAGALQALGLRLLRADGTPVGRGGAAVGDARAVDRTDLLSPPAGGVTVLTDVTAPLLGPSGAAHAFGPQKGAGPDEVRLLEASLARLAELLGEGGETAGAGSAGGTAYGLMAAWGARVEPGAGWIAELTGLATAIEAADVVLTGEGRFDSTSLSGKVVSEVLSQAAGKRVGIVAGSLAIEPPTDVWAVSLSELAGTPTAAMAEPERWLREAGSLAARQFGENEPA